MTIVGVSVVSGFSGPNSGFVRGDNSRQQLEWKYG